MLCSKNDCHVHAVVEVTWEHVEDPDLERVIYACEEHKQQIIDKINDELPEEIIEVLNLTINNINPNADVVPHYVPKGQGIQTNFKKGDVNLN